MPSEMNVSLPSAISVRQRSGLSRTVRDALDQPRRELAPNLKALGHRHEDVPDVAPEEAGGRDHVTPHRVDGAVVDVERLALEAHALQHALVERLEAVLAVGEMQVRVLV